MNRFYFCKYYELPLAYTSVVQRSRCKMRGRFCATCSDCPLQILKEE